MNFKKFFENSEDIKETLSFLPKKHLKFLQDLELKYTCNNTLDSSKKHVGILKDKKITVSAPWHYSRQFTTLHEIAHIVWCKALSEDQRKAWNKIFHDEKSRMRHSSVKQSAEEIFCMCYANYYSRHKLMTFKNSKWDKFIKNL